MPNTPHNLISCLRVMVVGAWRNDPRDDAELLAKYAETRDETAFTTLVGRHGTLVWRTCRQILGNSPDAEDAFQSTFLTLSRKAAGLRREPLAGWLYRVARRAAKDVREGSRRRQNLEQKLRTVSETKGEVEIDVGRAELYTALDEELAKLPERLRVPLLLRYLEGKTLEEVARGAGCSRRAIGKCLEKGETVLRERLERRGLTLGFASVAALLGNTVGATTVPSRLIESTTRAAVAFRAETLVGGVADGTRKLLRALAMQGMVRKLWWVVLMGIGSFGIGGTGLIVWKMCGGGSGALAPTEPAASKLAPLQKVPLKAVIEPRCERVDRFGDPLPDGALARIGTLRFRLGREGDRNGGIAFLPDGKTLVSYGSCSLYFWEWATGKLLRRLDKVGGKEDVFVRKIAVSPDGKVLAVRGQYWDLTTDPPQRLTREAVPTLMPDGDVAFSSDNTTVAWAGDNKNVYLVDASTGKVKRTLKNVEGKHLAFSVDGKTLAIGNGVITNDAVMDGELALWDVATGVKRLQIAHTGNPIEFLAFLPDGRTLLESRLKSGASLDELLTSVESGCLERIRFWDAATGKEKQAVGVAQGSYPFSRARGRTKCLSPDGKLIAVNDGESISVWDLATGREVGPVGGIRFPVDALAFSPDSKKLVTLSAADAPSDWHFMPELHAWETDTGRLEKELALNSFRAIASIHYSDERHVEMFCANVRNLEPFARPPCSPSEKIWDLLSWNIETGKIEEVKEKVPADLALLQRKSPRCSAVSSDGRWRALSLIEGIALLDGVTGREIRRFPGSSSRKFWGQCDKSFVVFAADGQSLLTYLDDPNEENQRLEIWSVATGNRRIGLPTVSRGQGVEESVRWQTEAWRNALSLDGRWLAAAGSNEKKPIRVMEVVSGMEWEGLAIPELKELERVVWSPDGRLLAGGDDKGTVWLWDMVNGREIRRFTGHQSEVTALAFSQDGLRLASGSRDTTVLIWDIHDLSSPKIREKNRPTAEALWASLGAKDPAVARRSINMLMQMPDVALPLLCERLRFASDRDQVETLLVQLDDNNFQNRHLAVEKLEKMGKGVELALREALTRKLSLEVNQNIDKVLSTLCGPPVVPSGFNVVQLRACRAIEVLERIGTPAARQLLEELSQLPIGFVQAEEAKAALHRLTKRLPVSTR